MRSPDSERETRAFEPGPGHPINLTAACEPMSWEQACKVVHVLGGTEEFDIDIRGVTCPGSSCLNNGAHETVYVIISGYGVLHSNHIDTEFTAGDLLFVPRGCPHCFERLNGDIKIWRISSVTP